MLSRRHNQYRRFVSVCSLERGANCSRVRKTQKSFDRRVVTTRQWASLSANENKTEQLQTVVAQVLPAAHASSRPHARAEHGDV